MSNVCNILETNKHSKHSNLEFNKKENNILEYLNVFFFFFN